MLTLSVALVLQCDPGLGASVMYDLLYNKPQKLMLLAGCSTVCTTVAEAAKMWNLVVVSEIEFFVVFTDENNKSILLFTLTRQERYQYNNLTAFEPSYNI